MSIFNSFQELLTHNSNFSSNTGLLNFYIVEDNNTNATVTVESDVESGTVESIDNELQYAGGVEASGSYADIAVNGLSGCDKSINTLIERLNDPNYTQEQVEATKRQIQRGLADISAHVTKAKTEIAEKKASGNQAKVNYAIKQETQINDLLMKIKPKLKQIGLSR